MTHNTDAELLRDIEEHMRNMWDARLLPAACWQTELAQRLTQAVRRAPAAPAPQGLFEAIEHGDAKHRAWLKAALTAFFAGRTVPLEVAAAPQPPDGLKRENPATKPEAAPVQLPEPDAWRYTDARGHYRYRGARHGFAVEYPLLKPEALYTDQQVRELLAAHGIGKDKA